MGNRVKRFNTNISDSQMKDAIAAGWQSLFKTTPTPEQIALIMAQNALETGHRKSMWNYNVGNLTTNGEGQYNYIDDLTTDEQIKPGQWEKKNLKYRAYNSLAEGIEDYLRFLSRSKRYANAWKYMLNPNPNPEAFSKALKDGGYYTADESKYTALIKKLYNQYSKTSGGSVNTMPPANNYTGFMEEITKKYNVNEKDILSQLSDSPKTTPPKITTPPPVTQPSSQPSSQLTEELPMTPEIETLLTGYLSQVRSEEKLNKQIYKRFLPENRFIIKIESKDPVDSIEFSRILCSALDEELLAKACTHCDDEEIEVEGKIYGPKNACVNAIMELTNVLSDEFKNATNKIGGIDIKTKVIINKRSSYQPISTKVAEVNYNKFMQKFL